MIVYKDQAWCAQSTAAGGCGNEKCFRNYTPEQKKQNEDGVDLPLSIINARSKECGYEPV